jgi:hypothetical protein
LLKLKSFLTYDSFLSAKNAEEIFIRETGVSVVVGRANILAIALRGGLAYFLVAHMVVAGGVVLGKTLR